MPNKNQRLITLLTGAATALKCGKKATAKKKIREAYRAVCTPATEAEIQAARLLYETDDEEIDTDALASHLDPKDGMGVGTGVGLGGKARRYLSIPRLRNTGRGG